MFVCGQYLRARALPSNNTPVSSFVNINNHRIDPSVIETHMKQMHSASTGVLTLSWYPPDSNDENGKPTNELVPTILDKAHKNIISSRIERGFKCSFTDNTETSEDLHV